MNMRALLMILATVVVSLLVLVTAYSQEDMTNVDNSEFSNPQRTPSVFRHEPHNEAADIEQCNECHHVYEDGKKLEDESSEDRCARTATPLKTRDTCRGSRKRFIRTARGVTRRKTKDRLCAANAMSEDSRRLFSRPENRCSATSCAGFDI